MTDDEMKATLAQMVEELANHEPCHLVLSGVATVQLAGLLQLALRHPHLDGTNRRTAIMVLDHIRAFLGDAPASLEAMRQGDDPRHDLPWRPRS